MKTTDWVRAIVEAVIWFFFIYYFLWSVRNPVNLWESALILIVLAYAAALVCPWLRHTTAWRRMTGKEI